MLKLWDPARSSHRLHGIAAVHIDTGIISVSAGVVTKWTRLIGTKPRTVGGSFCRAAKAIVHDPVLMTRNRGDFERRGGTPAQSVSRSAVVSYHQ
jgi:hypothetical protein